jgi:hypothetical protein
MITNPDKLSSLSLKYQRKIQITRHNSYIVYKTLPSSSSSSLNKSRTEVEVVSWTCSEVTVLSNLPFYQAKKRRIV